jgi:hypothetical protein
MTKRNGNEMEGAPVPARERPGRSGSELAMAVGFAE